MRRSPSAPFVAAILLLALVALALYLWRRTPESPAPANPSATPAASTLRLAFWNIRDLSTKSRDAAERALICDVVGDFDVVAICEVNDGEILPALVAVLDGRGHRWGSVTSAKVGNTPASAERYGLLYRDDELDVVWSRQLPEVTTEAGIPFDREPFVVGLKTEDGGFDFAVMIVHITWGKRAAPRIAEVKALARYYREIAATEPDIVLAGDFNRNADDERSVRWLAGELGVISTTDPAVPTVITGTSTYDQIMLRPALFAGNHGVIEFDDTVFSGDDGRARVAASDHRPIWAQVRVR